MIVAILGDVHGNREALEAVLTAAAREDVEGFWFLGDLVGYNPDPDYCVAEVLSRASHTVRGNHDKAVTGLLSVQWFNPMAREAVRWTRRTARVETLRNVEGLPEGPQRPLPGFVLCHGTPWDEDEYLIGETAVVKAFRWMRNDGQARVCFHGHTHRPLCCRLREGPQRPEVLPGEGLVAFEPGCLYLVNPGSVGQPRDGNPKASFGILDTDRLTYRTLRVAYAVKETMRKIEAAGLPRELAWRLSGGA
jgi:predicted phosphodiesterase